MQFFKSGAGSGIGLKKGEESDGSQGGAGEDVVGGQSKGIAQSGSGSATSSSGGNATATGKGKSAGVMLAPTSFAPLMVGVLATSFTVFGSFLL